MPQPATFYSVCLSAFERPGRLPSGSDSNVADATRIVTAAATSYSRARASRF